MLEMGQGGRGPGSQLSAAIPQLWQCPVVPTHLHGPASSCCEHMVSVFCGARPPAQTCPFMLCAHGECVLWCLPALTCTTAILRMVSMYSFSTALVVRASCRVSRPRWSSYEEAL